LAGFLEVFFTPATMAGKPLCIQPPKKFSKKS